MAAPGPIEHHLPAPVREEPRIGLSIDELKSLLNAFDESGWRRMKLAINGTRLEITRGPDIPPVAPGGDRRAPAAAHHDVIAPSVGVFHRGAAAGGPPSVELGTAVMPDDVVGVVQVMRRTHNVLAGVAGTVHAIHAEDQEPVEYGRLLFTVAAHQ